jgi:TolB protein
VGQVKLYAIRDLANALGASLEVVNGALSLQLENNVVIKDKVTGYTVNGATMNFTTAPKNVGGTLFAELNSIVDGLGGSVVTDASGKITFRSFKLLEGNFSSVNWIDGNKVIATQDGDTKAIYKVDPTTLTSELYSDNEDALSMIVSPDGKYGVYTNENAQLILMTLNPGVISTLSLDKSTKTDLTWSADSKKIYFAQGDNQEKISSIDLVSKAIKTVLEDKVNFKSDLRLSADGTKVLYNQNITGTATNDADSTEDSLKIDFSKAGTQLYSLDLATAGAKPVKLTDGMSNTLYANILNDGSAVYINIEPADDKAKGTLKMVSPAGVIKDLVTDLDVSSSLITSTGQFIITGIDAAGKTHVATVAADGKKTDLVTSDAELEGLSSPNGTDIFATIGGKIVLVKNSGILPLTK